MELQQDVGTALPFTPLTTARVCARGDTDRNIAKEKMAALTTSGAPELRVRTACCSDSLHHHHRPMCRKSRHPARPVQVNETWDYCIENTIKKLAYGTIAGGLAALILFRTHGPSSQACRAVIPQPLLTLPLADPVSAGTPSARSSITGLGCGVGVGMGYTECKYAACHPRIPTRPAQSQYVPRASRSGSSLTQSHRRLSRLRQIIARIRRLCSAHLSFRVHLRRHDAAFMRACKGGAAGAGRSAHVAHHSC